MKKAVNKQNSAAGVQKLEILAPAGSPECLIPALRMGADAVYLGAQQFSARGNAANFDRDALRQAVQECHVRGVKVYLAVNTLLFDTQLHQALQLVEFACSLPVDALIVQDVGLARLLRQAAPGMRLHGSTQMAVHTPAGVEQLARMGFSRVVLARELSGREIADIARSAPIELEVFVHGALCMSVSGQCYFSAMLGGRSGNRGLCAQPCRLPFRAPGGANFALSLKDNSLVPYLDELARMGVTSAKIEGRMKRPEYVAAAVAACRLAADGMPPQPQLNRQLEAVFSRSGFTDGYYTGRRGAAMFGIRKKEDVEAANGQMLAQIRQTYHKEVQRVPVRFSFSLWQNKPAYLCAQDGQGNRAEVWGGVPEEDDRGMDEAVCRRQLEKTGGTPYICKEITCHLDKGISLPLSAINAMRRQALEQISTARLHREPVAFSMPEHLPGRSYAAAPLRLRARFPHAQVPDVFSRFELVYVPLATPPEQLEQLLERGIPAAVDVPRGLFGKEDWARRQLQAAYKAGVRHARVGNLGALALAQEAKLVMHGSFALNLCNTQSLLWAKEQGLADVELSVEMTGKQIAQLGAALPRGVVGYGRLPLMLVRNCPLAAGRGASSLKKEGTLPRSGIQPGCLRCDPQHPLCLTDRKGARFPVQCERVGPSCGLGCAEVLNSVPLDLMDKLLNEKTGVDFALFNFTVENLVESEEKYLAFHTGYHPSKGYTRGLWDRGVE